MNGSEISVGDGRKRYRARKQTHFRLTDKQVQRVPDLSTWKDSLSVLHLERNRLQRWDAEMNCLRQLTHLCLEDNHLVSTEEIKDLPNLEKAFLGRNRIAVLEGFTGCPRLRILELQNQQLAAGDQLLFHPITLSALQASLDFLDVSGNHIDSLEELTILHNLETLVARSNSLDSLNALKLALRKWTKLRSAAFWGNPVQRDRDYTRAVVLVSKSIRILDGKQVTDVQRHAIQSVHVRKERAKGLPEKMEDRMTRLDIAAESIVDPYGLPAEDRNKVLGMRYEPLHEIRAPPLTIPDCIPRALWKVQNFACFFRQNAQRRRARNPLQPQQGFSMSPTAVGDRSAVDAAMKSEDRSA